MHEDFSFSFEKPPVVKKPLRLEDWSPWNPPTEHSFDDQTPERWDDVCTTIASSISIENLLDKKTSRVQARELCLAALREKPYWNDTLESSGKFLCALEITLPNAQLHDELDNTAFAHRITRFLESYSLDNTLSPLLRRKIGAILKKAYSPTDLNRVNGTDLEQKYGFFTSTVQE